MANSKSPTGYIEKYNEALKEKPVLSLTEKQNIIGKYYNTLNDVNAKLTCSEDAWQIMNNKQKSYIFFVQNKTYMQDVFFRQGVRIFVGFKKVSKKRNIIRYSYPKRYFKIQDDKLKVLKNKYPNFN